MIGHGEKISRLQEPAIAALLTHSSVGEAAKAIDVSEMTLYRWMAEPGFAEEYRIARKEAVNHAIRQVQSAMTEAIETLRKIMNNEEIPPSTRVSAAKTILDNGFKAAELEEFGERIERLEALAEKAAGR
jgi:valyl-tRNA synthetase